MITHGKVGNHTSYSSFHCSKGSDEYFLITTAEDKVSFASALQGLYKNYQNALKKLHLCEESEIFCRFYLNDIANQSSTFLKVKEKYFGKNSAYSLIEQASIPDYISVFSYHILAKGKTCHKRLLPVDMRGWHNALQWEGLTYSLYFTGNLSGGGVLDSYVQTNDIFSSYNNFLNDNKMSLLQNTVRTWIYVRDIENHYQGMVDARREYFFEQGLSSQTRFIASTGIEGKMKDSNCLVSLDALSIAPLDPKQIVRMEALANLNPTSEYKVTFERGTKIEYGDRNHLYISGTASIDKFGNVLHEADVEKQTKRSLDNIRALLKPHNAHMEDMLYLVVYIRNRADFHKVEKAIEKEMMGKIPIVYLEASVCRSSWLVEIEGEAIICAHNRWEPFK